MSRFKIYAKSILIPVIVGGIVGLLISGAIDYTSLTRPYLSPPSILFPIVWTILYILMGISFGILKEKKLVDTKTRIYLLPTTICKCYVVNNIFLIKMEIICIYMDNIAGYISYSYDNRFL